MTNPSAELRTGYSRFRARLAEAIDGRLFSIEYLDWLIETGQARLWHDGHSAIVAAIRRYPTGALVVTGLCACGKLKDIRKLIPGAEQWGREHGCVLALIESRIGWAQALREDGYQPHQMAVAKEL
jgi:hypothetical protein